ncbi:MULTISPECIES: UDP-2,4-diacetamido-2,4,6-trideoxy-beta-L-altropyranose hydrolase [unclassified Arsukibacterium]|uniref:UDP-2,4-diacetamido-2,4, 6-trideoxy-beta-L-altropyranose hydrolase n=1 Tax=unclassified Arsukibacterium TaxID=2635278 RepID=UPI000C8E3A11|nr:MULTISPECIES: UDP-2,4-diacetamido-2,4,6-trideoxy-beta-L-altropyranose hydrolase [unclassified Arsukibacterium]MAA96317.1 UDP-2,4-diacetamido-2,4,6-trideoxy-beta-L-altropyranose hydrolase [Rheinheimera sp.]|tara:strand:+ start:8152 stop:9711 length:1560 start_codon:yes stop_codon:yes gene_type:complete
MKSSSVTPNVVFRLDSSAVIGYGHLMRCLTLAAELRRRGANCFFICRDLPGNNSVLVKESGYNLLTLPVEKNAKLKKRNENVVHHAWLGTTWQQDAKQCQPYFSEIQPTLIIVDHYGLDARWESLARAFCQRLCVIDDLADRQHDCDFLLDYNLSVHKRDYAARVARSCQHLLGGKYVLLRQEFAKWQAKSIGKRDNNRLSTILITFGGVDRDNNSERVLQVLHQLNLPDLEHIDVVVSSKAPDLNSLKTYAKQMPMRTVVHTDARNMAELITAADLAIGSGGGSTYERLFLKLPSLLIPIADNQIKPLQIMNQKGLFELFFTFEELMQKLERYRTQNLPKVAAPVLFGAPFVSALILADSVTLADVKPWDVRRNFHWLQSDKLRQQFVMVSKPVRRSHFNYWRSLLDATHQYVFSILCNEHHVGSVGVKNLDVLKKEAEIWIYLGDTEQQSKGVGSKALMLLEGFIKYTLLLENIVLHVAQDNHIAQAFYQKHDYLLSDDILPDSFVDKNVLQMRKKL